MIKQFKLGAKTFKIKEIDTFDSCSQLGEVNSSLGIIRIARMNANQTIPEDSKEQTLCHEVVHTILDDLGYYELSSDETFVQSFACLLHQYETTKK